MARISINLISLSGNTLKDIGLSGVDGLIVSNTDTTDITFDLLVGPKTLHNGTSTTGSYFILKDIPIPLGSSFVWDDADVLTNIGGRESIITEYKTIKSKFESIKNMTFLIKVGSGHTADVVLKRR